LTPKSKELIGDFKNGGQEWQPQVTQNWRGRFLLSPEVVVHLISNTTTASGLRIHAQLDENAKVAGI